MNESKKPWQSKTLWMAFFASGLALFAPGVADWIKDNPQLVTVGLSGLFALLRVVTKGKVSIGDN